MGKLTSGSWLGLLCLIHISSYQHRAVWKGKREPSFVQASQSASAPKWDWKLCCQNLVTHVWLKQLPYFRQEGIGFHLWPHNWKSPSLSIRTLSAMSNIAEGASAFWESKPSWQKATLAQWRVLVDKSRQWGVHKLSLRPSKDSGWDGRELRGEGSYGDSCGRWRHLRSASSYEPPMMPSHLPESSNSGMTKTQSSLCAFVQQASSSSCSAARLVWHKVDTPGGTTRCSSAWQWPWKPGGHPSVPYFPPHHVTLRGKSLSVRVQP